MIVVIFLLAAVTSLAAQTRTVAERLGYPASTKLLIIHADDLGVAHSVNDASFAALDQKAVSSASIMVPTPWLTEVAAYARSHPDADLGLHLTMTSEWSTYRWGSVSPADRVGTLLDSAGTFFSGNAPVMSRGKAEEVEREVRAQIERALAVGIRPTHLDSHMGTLFATPGYFAVLAKVAHEHRLPFLVPPGAGAVGPGSPLTERDIPLDALVMAGPEVRPEHWTEFYLNAVRTLKPGLTEMIVHLGSDDAELRAVTTGHDAFGSAWRQRDFDVVTGPEFARALREAGVVLIGWRDLQKAWYGAGR